MPDEQRDGFELRGRFYPWAQQMRLMDPLLVTEVTGMTYTKFIESWQAGIASLEDEDVDPVVMMGLIAVAVWQQHPDWSRAKVVKLLEQMSQEDLEVIGGDEDVQTVPPTRGESENDSSDITSENSSPSPMTSNGSQGFPSEAVTLGSTGQRISATGSQGHA